MIILHLNDIAEKKSILEAQDSVITEFKSHHYPERCSSLQEQLINMSRHAQSVEHRVEAMEKERKVLRMAIANEIEFLRSA